MSSFFCIFSKIFYGAGMSLASAAERECLNFSNEVQLAGIKATDLRLSDFIV